MSETGDKKKHFIVEWRDGFKIDIPQVDREHKHLFSLVRQLEIETATATVEELLDYVVTHFSNEQKLMEDSGYPGFSEHLKLHEQFGATVADFLSSGDEWTEERVNELRRFLNKWLIGHIMTHDLRFGNWYRDTHGGVPEEVDARNAKSNPKRSKVGWFDRLLGRS